MSSPNVDLSRQVLVKFGKHASATDVSVDAVTTYFVEPQTDPEITTDVQKLERDLVRGDNEEYNLEVGPKDTAINLTLEVRGAKTAGGAGGSGDGVTAAYATNTQIGSLLDVVCGVAGTNAAGDTTDGSDAGSGTTVTMDGSSALGANQAILVKGTTSTKYEAREVISASSADVTVCRALTNDDGGADTALEAMVAYAASSWYLDADNANHTHAWFDVEGSNWRRKLFGCMGNCTFEFPSGGIATASFNFTGTDWSDVAEANPTFSEQRAYNPVVCIDSPFHIGATRYDLLECSVDFGIQTQPKQSFDGANGFEGYAVTRKQPVITAKLYYSDTLMNTLQAGTAQDVLAQFGRDAGSAIAFRMPAGAPRNAKRSITNGLETIDVEFVGSRPSAGDGALRIHLF